MDSEEKAGHFSSGKRMGVPPEMSGRMGWRGTEVGPDVCVLWPSLPALPAQLLATLLIQYERLQGVQSSGVLIIFWFLCVLCAIIPFRSKILSAVEKVRGKGHLPGPRCLGGDLRAQGHCWVSGSSPLSLSGSQDLRCGSVLFVLFSTCCISARKQTNGMWGGGDEAEDRCNSGEWSHCWIFVGARGAVL